jgi:hypothetical protein
MSEENVQVVRSFYDARARDELPEEVEGDFTSLPTRWKR